MILGRASSIRQRGGALATSASKGANCRLFSGKGPTSGSSKSGGIAADGPAGTLSKSEILAVRQKRKAAMPGGKGEVGGGGAGTRKNLGVVGKAILGTTAGGGALALAWHYKREMFNDTPIEGAVEWCSDQIAEVVKPWTEPSSKKLLPDWPMPNVPPGVPCPPLLVLDLEGTILATVFDSKNGWRFAKRPGLDDFLKEMHQMYEIAIFTNSHGADEVINKLDPNGYVSYRLFREATKWTDGKHVKDLTHLNRPIEKIVIIDDNPECFSLQPENAIQVGKYSLEDDSFDEDDTVLPDLAPVLRALATQDVRDFRDILRPFIGKDSSALVANFRSKVAAVRDLENTERTRGLGGLLRRGVPQTSTAPPIRRAALTSKDIVGDAPETLPPALANGSVAVNAGSVPVAEESRGALWKRFDAGAKERMEELQEKSEAFQMVMQKREEREQARKAEKRAKQRSSG